MSRIYYHGTENRHAFAIMTQGFKLGELRHGRILGRGLYVTQRKESAFFWSQHIVIKCHMRPGTRILWIQEGYDRKIIRHLRREFGQELLDLGPHFTQAVPHNKQLTKNELVALCNYIFETKRNKSWQYILARQKGKRAQYRDSWLRLSRLHEQVRRFGYDGLGDRSFEHWDSDEILLFNPSRMIPISAHWLHSDEEWENIWLSDPIPLDELHLISSQAQEEYDRDLQDLETDES